MEITALYKVIVALIEDKKKNNGKQKEEKERNKERAPNPATLDYSVASYEPHGSYGGPFMKAPTQGKYIYLFIKHYPLTPLLGRHSSCYEMHFSKRETKLK